MPLKSNGLEKLSDEDRSWIEALARRQKSGHPLERALYEDPRVFELDLERILLRSWMLVGHVSRLPNPGDYFVFRMGGESVIITRTLNGSIEALLNVCRHRGSIVCVEDEGCARSFVCPYHAWAYGLDGQLLHARNMPDDFDRARYGMNRVQLRTFEGLIFICFSDQPPNLEPALGALAPFLKTRQLANTRIAERLSFTADANWKLVIENWLECYHCLTAHPEYCESHPDDLFPGQRGYEEGLTKDREWESWCTQRGFRTGGFDRRNTSYSPFQQGYALRRGRLVEGYLTGSEDGRPVAPLLGEEHEYDRGETAFEVSPLSYGVAHSDHAVLFRFTPIGPLKTDIELTWLVRADAREQDFDAARVAWLWRSTIEKDIVIVSNNQRGVSSRFYEPGPYSKEETILRTWTEWYLTMIGPRYAYAEALSIEGVRRIAQAAKKLAERTGLKRD